LLDEVLVAFGAVHLQAIGATMDERSAAIASWIIGGFVGLAALERLVSRIGVRQVLLAASSATAFALITLAVARSPYVGAFALLLIGTTGSMLHPLTKAQAYRALPNRPALVNAVGAALLPLDMAAPIVLGIVATFAGSAWAIVALLVAPAGVVLAARQMPRGERSVGQE
jgi:fucose permease